MKLPLYPWQNECLNAWSSHEYHGIVNVVTGAGKTILALAAMDHLKSHLQEPLRVKIVVPTTFLLSQWRNALLKFTDSPPLSRDDIGHYYGARKDSPDHNCMIYVINSARFCLARHIIADLKEGYSVLLITDECHHYTSEENRKIFDFLPFLDQLPGHYYSLGLSATPQTLGYESVLVPAIGTEIYRYGFSDAAKGKTISPFAIFQIALSLDAEELNDYEDFSVRITHTLNRLVARHPSLKHLSGSQFFGCLNSLSHGPESPISALASAVLTLIYQRNSLVCNAKSRLSCACKLINSLEQTAKIIIFGERIEQADQIYHLLSRQFPNQVGRCHSKLGHQARTNALDRYRSGELRILVSCRALDEGFDVPMANVGIILSSTSVERQRIQRLGRILRHHESKDISSLYYLHLGNAMEECSFISDIPEEAYSCNLSYSEVTCSFSFPEYEEYAVRVLQKFKKTSPDKTIWKEAQKCLIEGMVRPDWFLGDILGDDVWDNKIQDSKTIVDKNYWICMREMGRFGSRKKGVIYDD